MRETNIDKAFLFIMENEIWKSIKGFEGYEVSSIGNVRSYRCKVYESIILKQRLVKGYYSVNLYKKENKNKLYTKKIHRLIAETFIENVDNKPMVNHIDNNKTNNNILNLEWVTARENVYHGDLTKNNISKHIGITFNKNTQKWIARITQNGKRTHLGSFSTEIDAYLIRKNAEKQRCIINKYSV